MAKQDHRRGAAAFDRHFTGIYAERWSALREALLRPAQTGDHVHGLLQPYFLDACSVRAALALGVEPGDEVLDLCAAPGGKTLVLALALAGRGRLISNDRSADRRGRLKRVVADHLPPECAHVVTVTGFDATKWGLHEHARYDKVLLDAPCSSERHVLQSPSHLATWSPGRTRTLSQQALAMGCAALEALRPGGTMVYSTCSISPEENEKLVERLAAKRPGQFTVVSQTLVLPDTDGEGPLFWAVLRKSEATRTL